MGADKWLGIQSRGPEGESDRERAGEAGGKRKTETEAERRWREGGKGSGRQQETQQKPSFSTSAPVALGAVLSIPGQ